jgi:glucosamine kinase
MKRSGGGRNLFLGVDGGGTKTVAVAVDAHGHECGRGISDTANHEAVGFERALQHVRAAVDAALEAAGGESPVTAAWIGLAGVDRPADRELFLPHLESLARTVQLTNDAELALTALACFAGVALIAGTGSIAVGRSASGETARAGGWGHLLGDEGSGYDLGRQALQAALRCADGRGEWTLLLDLILEAWHLARIEDVMWRVYQRPDKAEIARLSAVVFAAAQSGDPVARGIVRRGASELAQSALAVGRELGCAASMPLALGGGLLVHERGYRQQVLRRLRARLRLDPVRIVAEPALSAARAARGLAASQARGKKGSA